MKNRREIERRIELIEQQRRDIGSINAVAFDYRIEELNWVLS